MKIGLIGRKRGMTRVFTEEGNSVPVTVVEVSPNRVTQVKATETDGYRAVQVTSGTHSERQTRKRFSSLRLSAGLRIRWMMRCL